MIEGEATPRAIDEATDGLEGTYLIRLFAEFETALRRYWATVRPARGAVRMQDLMEAVAARRGIGDPIRLGAHQVREHRNNLVHSWPVVEPPMTLEAARSKLCSFLSWMPLRW